MLSPLDFLVCCMLQLSHVFPWHFVCFVVNSLSLSLSLTATILHASFRTPNLKARLNTFREEFRAVWRNYSEL